MERHRLWEAIAGDSVATIPQGFLQQLDVYRDWLLGEAVTGGGIGPEEAGRVDRRHIADSLLFSLILPPDPSRILDVGTGVGLPGIPLAILLPETRFTLLDRSQRRVEMARRAVRILTLENVDVVRGQVPGHADTYPVVVSRATIPPDQFEVPLRDLVEPGGLGVIGGSWREPPSHEGYVAQEIGSAFLAQDVWILIMRQQ